MVDFSPLWINLATHISIHQHTSFSFKFSSKLDRNYSIISNAKIVPKKIRTLIFLEVALYFYKSTIQPCMEYCFCVGTGAPRCFLEMLGKVQKQICRTVGLSLAASLEPLVYHQNVAGLSLFHRYYFGRCLSELAQLVPLP